MAPKIRSFTDLTVWQKAHNLALEVYSLTKEFPKEELYVLTSQMRRCSLSISSNIAEGFSRYGKKEKTQFYVIAKGSLTELQNQFYYSRDVGYVTPDQTDKLMRNSVDVLKLLNGIIRSSYSK